MEERGWKREESATSSEQEMSKAGGEAGGMKDGGGIQDCAKSLPEGGALQDRAKSLNRGATGLRRKPE